MRFIHGSEMDAKHDKKAAGHDAAIKAEIVNLSQLIPLKLTINEYYNNKGIDVSQAQQENEFFNVVFIDNVPQQSHGSLDCGIYILAFAEYLSYGQGIPVNVFDASCLRSRYATLLCNYGQQKNDAGAISDNEAPPRYSKFNVAMQEIDTIQID
ncbi:uncharacterized protein [Solanum lycopersicum]|uniref:uncharacterized protein isoform X2 n=1 Tax=Solanum lycopersicum TaxID=4081 RepID=UPI003747BA1D